MTSNPVIEAIKSRRAIRSYEEKAVPEQAIQTLLEAAVYAPTAINIQPWKFVIITNKEELNKLSDIVKPIVLRALPDVGDQALTGLKQRLVNPQFSVFYNAPLLVLVAGPKGRFVSSDCTMASLNMMLAAHSIGLGSCWVGSGVDAGNVPSVKAELNIPEDHEVFAAVIFGYPKEKPKQPEKRPPQVLKRVI